VLRELVLKYRENIVHVRTAADHMEEKLKAEILFLKEQIQAEQCLKENLEETLQLEIENCKEEIGECCLGLGCCLLVSCSRGMEGAGGSEARTPGDLSQKGN
jgi:hypothetical protein